MSERSDQSPGEEIGRISLLNDYLERNLKPFEWLPYLRSLPKPPILLDIDGVLISEIEKRINPQAVAALKRLQRIGSCVYVTTSMSWNAKQNELRSFGLWNDQTVLLVPNNYSFLSDSDNQQAAKLRNKCINRLHRSLGLNLINEDLIGPIADKKIAPLFTRKHLIPLLDDNPHAVTNNPGVKGVLVDKFENGDYQIYGSISLLDSCRVIEEMYSNL